LATNHEGGVLRKLALLTSASAVIVFATLAQAQQVDINVGGDTFASAANATASASNLRAVEKGGTYLNVGFDVIPFRHSLGLGFETTWKYHKANDPYGQPYRPILYDVNAVFQPRLGKKIGGEFMVGIGGQSTRFYGYANSCTTSCVTYVSSNHFAEHLGAGVRYYFWRHFFLRPEIHYYHIQNNTNDFTSNNVFRMGASIGLTIGPD
jgi:Outer membrane protein beta-barrel domain